MTTNTAIITTAAAVTMTSLELLELVNEARANFKESAVRHNDFLARCRDELDGEVYETFVHPPEGFRPATQAIRMNADQCKLVAMRESKGVRRRVLARLNELEARVVQKPAFNPAELSRLDILKLAMESEQARIEAEDKLAIAAPKAEALDRITLSDGAMCITNAAKTLGLGPKRLFAWLQEKGWIYRRAGGSGFVGYQSRIQVGYLDHKITLVTRSDGSEKTVEQVLVTPKGLAKLAAVLNARVAA